MNEFWTVKVFCSRKALQQNTPYATAPYYTVKASEALAIAEQEYPHAVAFAVGNTAAIGRDYSNAYRYLRENHSINAANRILENAMSHEGQTRKDLYGFGITYTDGFFYTEAQS